MAKKKNKPQDELEVDSVESTSTEDTSATDTVQESSETPVVVEAQQEPSLQPEETKEEVKVQEDVPKIKEASTENKTVESDFSTLESIAKFVTKTDPTFATIFFSLNRGSESLLIKQAGGVYCFCRVVPRSRNQNGQIWEAEFLTNVPAQVHTKLVKILKDAGVPDSKRQFFNPSGHL